MCFFRIGHNVENFCLGAGIRDQVSNENPVCLINFARSDELSLRPKLAPRRYNFDFRTLENTQIIQTLRRDCGQLWASGDLPSRDHHLAFAQVPSSNPNKVTAANALFQNNRFAEAINILLHNDAIRPCGNRCAGKNSNRAPWGNHQPAIRPGCLFSGDPKARTARRIFTTKCITIHGRVIETRQRDCSADIFRDNSVGAFRE